MNIFIRQHMAAQTQYIIQSSKKRNYNINTKKIKKPLHTMTNYTLLNRNKQTQWPSGYRCKVTQMKVQLAYTIVAKGFEIAITVAVWSNVIALAW